MGDKRLHTVRDWVDWGAERFRSANLHYGHGTDNAGDEALALVLHALGLDHSVAATVLDLPLDGEQRLAVRRLLQRRIQQRLPLAYLTGSANFAGLSFHVTEDVLVPRSPIAELILARFHPWLAPGPCRILDLCTGSGCIGIACAHHIPGARVDATDISASALAVADINRRRHGLVDRVSLWQSDLFAGLPVARYDLIVSNPPYVDARDMADLPEEYRHEPRLALEAGVDGLDLVVPLLRQARRFLTDTGILIVEVGNSERHLQQRYPQVPFLWLQFAHGGHGVFLLDAQQLDEFAPVFAGAATGGMG